MLIRYMLGAWGMQRGVEDLGPEELFQRKVLCKSFVSIGEHVLEDELDEAEKRRLQRMEIWSRYLDPGVEHADYDVMAWGKDNTFVRIIVGCFGNFAYVHAYGLTTGSYNNYDNSICVNVENEPTEEINEEAVKVARDFIRVLRQLKPKYPN